MKKIGIYCLGFRRLDMLRIHLPNLSRCKYTDFQFYLLCNEVREQDVSLMRKYLPNNHTIVTGFDRGNNYIQKIWFASNQPHDFLVKLDEDCMMTSESWDKFFLLIESMSDEDLVCTGAINNGIPTCDIFIKNFIPEAQNELNEMFSKTRYGNMGFVDYTSLNHDGPWNSDDFWNRVDSINHHFKGIHPVRLNFAAAFKINEYILLNPKRSMSPINSEIIVDNSKYPYFCNSLCGAKTKDYKTIIERQDLFVDPFEEVPLNKYRKETGRNLVIDTGIPMLHTMYNWCPDQNYETNLINKLIEEYGE